MHSIIFLEHGSPSASIDANLCGLLRHRPKSTALYNRETSNERGSSRDKPATRDRPGIHDVANSSNFGCSLDVRSLVATPVRVMEQTPFLPRTVASYFTLIRGSTLQCHCSPRTASHSPNFQLLMMFFRKRNIVEGDATSIEMALYSPGSARAHSEFSSLFPFD